LNIVTKVQQAIKKRANNYGLLLTCDLTREEWLRVRRKQKRLEFFNILLNKFLGG
jgi:hypothetical protein